FRLHFTDLNTEATSPELILFFKKEGADFQYAALRSSSNEKWAISDQEVKFVSILPLYTLPEKKEQSHTQASVPVSNFTPETLDKISKKISLQFKDNNESNGFESASPVCYANSSEVNEEFKTKVYPQEFTPIDLLDYIYGNLYSPSYLKENKDLLKSGFLKIPLPKNQIEFWKLAEIGKQLRQLHLLEGESFKQVETLFPIGGDNIVKEVRFEENYEIQKGDVIIHIDPLFPMGRIYINETQYFECVPQHSWEFLLGEYPPAKSWLTKKMGQSLTSEEIYHFQKIIHALTETGRIIKEMEEIKF
ncbi:MAG: type ISP restriction/modification enzyme, partial [Ginsengibacter sp.]